MMLRRSFLAAPLLAQTPGPRPNILWLSFEDSSPMLGCYGDPHAITPNVDAFAQQAVRYTRAYTVAGVCAPSRSGIITGMYPTTLGSSHMRSNAMLPPHVRCFPAYLRDAGYYCTNNAKTDYNFAVPRDAWDESGGKAHWKNRPAGKPFFAVFNLEVTHESRYPRRGAEHEADVQRLQPRDRQDPAKLTTLPPYYPDTPETRRDWANVYEGLTAMDYWLADRLREIDGAGLANDTIVFVWGDHGVGLPRAKRWLYESSTRVPLLIRVPGKFRAAAQAAPGSVDDQLVSFIDLAPTVLNLAGIASPEHFQGRAFLGPKLTPQRRYIHGARDRMDERYDMVRMVRDERYRYIRNYEPEKPYTQFMATPEQGPTMRELRRQAPPAARQFMAATKPPEELYDVAADPHEISNLAGDGRHRKTLARLRAEHARWARDTRDLGLIPEPELVRREKMFGSRYAILRQPDSLALIKRLRSPRPDDADPAVRYWAARRGANLLRDSSAIVRIAAARRVGNVDVLAAALNDPDEWTRLAAAQALDELGEAARPALARLRERLQRKDENNYVLRVLTHAVRTLTNTSSRIPGQ
jgi:N-sulfoglucosamine sulfohydrolase